MDTFNSNIQREARSNLRSPLLDSDDDEDGSNGDIANDGFYPKQYDGGYGIVPGDDGDITHNNNALFAFDKLAVENLQRHFMLEYDRMLPPNLKIAQCKYFGSFQGGCWGRVNGRIVYSNCDYQQGGNYPCEILFSCEAHNEEDFTDEGLDKCQNCEKLFRKKSMINPHGLICKTCYDSKKLQQKCIWVNLNKKGLKQFNFSHICQYTLNVADRRNLPKSLKSYGKIKAQLTYEIPQRRNRNNDEDQEDDDNNGLRQRRNRNNNDIEQGDNDMDEEKNDIPHNIDLSRISINTFWENNEPRISSMMDKFKETLKTAQSRKTTRAVLVYYDGKDKQRELEERRLQQGDNNNDVENGNNNNENNNANADEHERKENENNDDNDDEDDVEIEEDEDVENQDSNTKYIEILADPGVLFDGLDGVDYIFLTVSAWTQFYSILCPILFSLFCTLYFLYELDIYNYNSAKNMRQATSDSANGISLPDAPSKEQSSSMYLFYALGAFLILITGAFIAYKFQRKCEQVFRAFLVLDIFLILSIGFAILFVILGVNYNLTMDTISFWLLVYNFGIIGVMTFYVSVPPLLHRIFLVILNCIMSIMITSAISWYVLFLLLILVCAEIIAMIKPSFGRMFSPFLVPTIIQLPNTTPRIFYQVYGLRVRAPEFMFYGLMLGLIESADTSDSTDTSSTNTYYSQVILLLITVISGFVISVFVMPFFSKQIRPLPVSFTLLIISIIFYKQIFNEYQNKTVWSLVVP